MEGLGTHTLLELNDCNPKLIDDLAFVQKLLINATKKMGATIIGQAFHKFSPQGVTGVISIAESHLSIHTWPEYGYAAVDIFSCGHKLDPQKATSLIVEKLECKAPSLLEVRRGIRMTQPALAQ
ncbi:MAG: adenosylmethionine decarboxylase [Elusimicrobia bacterium]|nr:adenosylmethionine decarboxylase [Elusimicrobiota bacterium]